MKQWEYKVEKPSYISYIHPTNSNKNQWKYIDLNTLAEQEYLEKMGKNGWELVNVTSPSMGNSYVYH